MKSSLWRSLIITKIVALLIMVIPLQAMLYRAMSRTAQLKQRSSLQKNVKQRPQVPQQRTPIKPKFTIPKQQRFNTEQSSMITPKKSWGALIAAFGLGWLWYNKEDKEKKDEEKPEEKTTEKQISLSQFIAKFEPPKKIKETIEAHKDALAPRRVKPYLIEGTQPPIYHKWNDIDRIINAELLREVIKQNNLDIEIPNKYIYPNPNNGKYEVFAQGIPVRTLGTESLTLKEIQALIKLTIESRYTDLSKDNLFRDTHNNKFVIIDTEDISFLRIQRSDVSKAACVDSALRSLNRDFKIDKDAQVWATDYLKKLKESKEGKDLADLYTSRYNTLNISAEKAKELKQELKKQNREQESFSAQVLWRMKHAIQSIKR